MGFIKTHAKYVIISLILFSIFLFVINNILVFALDSSSNLQKGLTLSPLRTELNIDPGTSIDGALIVTNSTNNPIVVSMSAEEFSVINQQYDYSFTKDSNMANWVRFDNAEIDLAVGESKEVKYALNAPLSAEPGGRYISLFASTTTQNSETINSQQRIASLLYINVVGNVTRSGTLISLSAPWGVTASSNWSAAIQNTGTTHFRSRYNVQVLNIFNNNAVANSQGDDLILPGTVRLISSLLTLPNLPGLYKVIYTIGLGDTPAVIETRYMIYASPLVITMLAIIIFLVIVICILRHKRSNRHQSV